MFKYKVKGQYQVESFVESEMWTVTHSFIYFDKQKSKDGFMKKDQLFVVIKVIKKI